MRFTSCQYDQAIAALHGARDQLMPDATCCRLCHDTGHQAWECGHNPLLAMAICGDVARRAQVLHDRLHAIEEAMNDEDSTAALADWREDIHDLLHFLAGHEIWTGARIGPACVVTPELAASVTEDPQ